MLKILIDNGLGAKDYTRYVTPASISINKQINQTTTAQLTLSNVDNNFVMPVPRCYVQIYSEKEQRNIFTGFLTSDPTRTVLGPGTTAKGQGFDNKIYSFQLALSADDYLLSIKSVPFLPGWTNQTQGQILTNLAEVLCPGYFDTSGIASGALVPFQPFDPTKTWTQIAQTFGNGSRFYFYSIDKKLFYLPYGDGALGIVYDESRGEKTFDPYQLQSSAVTTQVVNDITVIGQQEAGNAHEDHFIGDGFTGSFPLLAQAYGLSSAFQGSSVLLADSWSNNSLNTQNWVAQDPSDSFNYGAGELNITTALTLPTDASYIMANNAIELAGGVVMQHGELYINDYCEGLIGGVYDDQTLNPLTCEAAFELSTPTQVVQVTLSGAVGINITPFRQGAAIPNSFVVTSAVNKSYTLYTKVQAPVPTRYQQVYRSLAGVVFGGLTQQASVSGSITWQLVESDEYTGAQTTYNYTVACELPDTAIYALVNNERLNISLASTSIWTPPPASLLVASEVGAGALGQIYVSGNIQYTGAYVTPTGGNLPILPQNLGQFQQYSLGSGLGTQDAELDSETLTSTLNFYSNNLPGVGVRIMLQWWEGQAAISRMRDAVSIANEAAVVGDDGVRATTTTSLSPLPRTSEDCDNAAAAFLTDRTGIYYQGTYTVTSVNNLFFSNPTADPVYWPQPGRFLPVNAPTRNMANLSLLVSSVTITVVEMKQEIMTYALNFSPDYALNKLLPNLVAALGTNIMSTQDSVTQPTPQYISMLGASYLPDVVQTTGTPIQPLANTLDFGNKGTFHANTRARTKKDTVIFPVGGPVTVYAEINDYQTYVTSDYLTITFLDAVDYSWFYEVRSADLGWGFDNIFLIERIPCGQVDQTAFSRLQYDQSWYLRLVSNPNTANVVTSRRTKVIRVAMPRVPGSPVILQADTNTVQLDLSGDIRNIEGMELTDEYGNLLFRTIVGSRYDCFIQMNLLRGQISPGENGIGDGIGKYLYAYLGETGGAGSETYQRGFYAAFFNLMWEYSPATYVYVPPLSAPTITEAFRSGLTVQVNIAQNQIDVANNRNDFQVTEIVFAGDNAYQNVYSDITGAGAVGSQMSNVPVSGDVYVRARFYDQVGPGAWSNNLVIPQGNLIASDYLAGQGSTPPVVTSIPNGTGGIFAYVSYYDQNGDLYIQFSNSQFTIMFPNNYNATIEASSTTTYQYDAVAQGPLVVAVLQPSTSYTCYPTVTNPTTVKEALSYGALLNTGDAASAAGLAYLAQTYSDGNMPLTSGGFSLTTAAVGSAPVNSSGSYTPPTSTGGGFGGTGGGTSCGCRECIIETENDLITLDNLKVGDIVRNPLGELEKVLRIDKHKAMTYELKTKGGRRTRGSASHTLQTTEGDWLGLRDVGAIFDEGTPIYLRSVSTLKDEVVFFKAAGVDTIFHLFLGPAQKDKKCSHMYVLDGLWSHNTQVKLYPE